MATILQSGNPDVSGPTFDDDAFNFVAWQLAGWDLVNHELFKVYDLDEAIILDDADVD